MFKKSISKTMKIVLCSFVVLLVITFLSETAFAREEKKVRGRFFIGLNVGAGITRSNYLDREDVGGNECGNLLVKFYLPWPWQWPWPDPSPRSDPPWWHITVEVGYNVFKWNVDEIEVTDKNAYWWNININPMLNVSLGKGKLKPFLNMGPGVYIPKEGGARFGGKIGIGVDFQLSDRLIFEMGTDYHHIFLKEGDFTSWGNNTNFNLFHGHVGIAIGL